jgi:hypothetical protein
MVDDDNMCEIYRMSWYDSKGHKLSYPDMYFLKEQDTKWGHDDTSEDLLKIDRIIVSKDSNEYGSAVNNEYEAEHVGEILDSSPKEVKEERLAIAHEVDRTIITKEENEYIVNYTKIILGIDENQWANNPTQSAKREFKIQYRKNIEFMSNCIKRYGDDAFGEKPEEMSRVEYYMSNSSPKEVKEE